MREDENVAWVVPFISAAYLALHPETRNGARMERIELRQLGEVKADRFTADTATKTNQSERTVQRDAERGEHVAPSVLTVTISMDYLLQGK